MITKKKTQREKYDETNERYAKRKPTVTPPGRGSGITDYVSYFIKNGYDMEPSITKQEAHVKSQNKKYMSWCTYLLKNGKSTPIYNNVQKGKTVLPGANRVAMRDQANARNSATARARNLGQTNHFEKETWELLVEELDLQFIEYWEPDGCTGDIALSIDGYEFADIELKSGEECEGGLMEFDIPRGKYNHHLIIAIAFHKLENDEIVLTQVFVVTDSELPNANFKPAVDPVRADTYVKFRYRLDDEEHRTALRSLLEDRIQEMGVHKLEDIFFSPSLNTSVSVNQRTELDGFRSIYETLPSSVEMTFAPNKNEATDFALEYRNRTLNISGKTATFNNDDHNGNYSGYRFNKAVAPNSNTCDWVWVTYFDYDDRSIVTGYSVIPAQSVYGNDAESFCWNKSGGRHGVENAVVKYTDIRDCLKILFPGFNK
jgi:hypothetical protein